MERKEILVLFLLANTGLRVGHRSVAHILCLVSVAIAAFIGAFFLRVEPLRAVIGGLCTASLINLIAAHFMRHFDETLAENYHLVCMYALACTGILVMIMTTSWLWFGISFVLTCLSIWYYLSLYQSLNKHLPRVSGAIRGLLSGWPILLTIGLTYLTLSFRSY